ncbi:MAG: PqqD family protein [Mycobacteriales bacterium]
MEQLTDDDVFTQTDQVVFRDFEPGKGAALLLLDTGAYHGVNDVGARVWHLLDGERSVGAVIRQLQLDVPDAPAEVADDVRRFLADLETRSLVRRS